MINDAETGGTSPVPRPVVAGLGRPRPARRLPIFLMAGLLIVTGLVVAWLGQRATARALARPGVVGSLSPASHTVTIRLTPRAGPSRRPVAARSPLVGGENRERHLKVTS